MSKEKPHSVLIPLLLCLCCAIPDRLLVAESNPAPLGIFEGQSDIGSVTPPGTAEYNPATASYTVTAAGDDMWSAKDDFHFVWKKVSGDLSLTSTVAFPSSTSNSHPRRKAVLMLRQTLDTDSAYADATEHGVNSTTLQYRLAKGGKTQDIELKVDRPQRIRLEKRGDTITLFLSTDGEAFRQVGASMKLHLTEPFYAGLGVCSHNANVVEKAVFTNVELKRLSAVAAQSSPVLFSTLKTIGIDDDMRQAIVRFTAKGQFEAPNWTRDGKSLIFDQRGRMMTLALAGGEPTPLEVGGATRCTGSHGLSPDGKWLAITCNMPDRPGARIYVVPPTGGTPRLVTQQANSYFHSWSPDGRTIAFTRPAAGSFNIYTIPAEGGDEKAVTSGTGVNDDPDFSPDGKYIYFNSDRGGPGMQIWRMHQDGTQPEQVTSDEMVNWTAHPSPDGKYIVFISYEKGTTGHPANKGVALRVMSLEDKKVRTIVTIVGGSGTMNTPPWAPDSRHFAFVSYQLLSDDASASPK